MSWTDERVTLLRQLWGEGKTAAEIAKELGDGVTRNAVIGKAHRLKLASRISPIQQNNKKAAPKKAPDKIKTAISIVTRQQIVKAVIEKKRTGPVIRLEELNESMCRWPIGDPKSDDFGFCGCKSEPNLPYCGDHAVMAYQITSKKKQLKAEEFEETGNAVTAAAGEDIKVA